MLGSNVPTIGGIHKGFYWASQWNCQCIQIYVTLSRRWEVPKLSPKEITTFKEEWGRSPVKKIVAHVPFLVNLASPNKSLRQKSKRRLMTELSRTQVLGVDFLVLHPGSFGTSNQEDGLKRITESLNEIGDSYRNQRPKILLETMAGQGTTLGSSFEEIAHILRMVENKDLLGVCFDTAHVFISGYDIRTLSRYENIMNKFDDLVGISQIKAFHFNDSKTGLGSHADRHACIGEGQLGLTPFKLILGDRRFLNIPKILEIPERDKRSQDNLQLLRKLCG